MAASGNGTFNETVSIKCTNWTYDKQYFDQTLVTEWNLVCDKALIIRTIVSVMNLATLLSAIYTLVQDRFGRKRAFLLNLTVFLAGSCGSLWSPNPLVFGILKFIGGISCMWNICFCWALEFVGPSKRSTVAITMSFVYAIANLSLVVLAYFSNTWRELAFVTSFPFILLYSYVCFMPESPRWLLTQGRIDESLTIMKRIAKWNRTDINVDELREKILHDRHPKVDENVNDTSQEKINEIGFVDFFRSKNLIMKSILLTLSVVLTNQLYVAIPFNMENFDANYYVAYVLQAIVEPPAILVNLFFLNRVGRVLPLVTSMIIGGLACIITWPLEGAGAWATLIATMISRFLICIGIPITQQLASELYPTVARGTGNSVTLIVQSVVSVSTQYILYTSTVWKALPMIIMGTTTLIGGILVSFLPETMGKSLPDTIADAERQGSVGWTAFKSHFVSICSKS